LKSNLQTRIIWRSETQTRVSQLHGAKTL
jgi:hypothetical protein